MLLRAALLHFPLQFLKKLFALKARHRAIIENRNPAKAPLCWPACTAALKQHLPAIHFNASNYQVGGRVGDSSCGQVRAKKSGQRRVG